MVEVNSEEAKNGRALPDAGKAMKIGIVGSRSFDDRAKGFCAIAWILHKRGISMSLMVSGGAAGADRIGEEYADANGIPKLVYPADWKRYGRQAGFIRNGYIIRDSDIIIALWDMKSHGTKDDLTKAADYGKPSYIYDFISGTIYEQIGPSEMNIIGTI